MLRPYIFCGKQKKICREIHLGRLGVKEAVR
jgi:hypothetical protein